MRSVAARKTRSATWGNRSFGLSSPGGVFLRRLCIVFCATNMLPTRRQSWLPPRLFATACAAQRPHAQAQSDDGLLGDLQRHVLSRLGDRQHHHRPGADGDLLVGDQRRHHPLRDPLRPVGVALFEAVVRPLRRVLKVVAIEAGQKVGGVQVQSMLAGSVPMLR